MITKKISIEISGHNEEAVDKAKDGIVSMLGMVSVLMPQALFKFPVEVEDVETK